MHLDVLVLKPRRVRQRQPMVPDADAFYTVTSIQGRSDWPEVRSCPVLTCISTSSCTRSRWKEGGKIAWQLVRAFLAWRSPAPSSRARDPDGSCSPARVPGRTGLALARPGLDWTPAIRDMWQEPVRLVRLGVFWRTDTVAIQITNQQKIRLTGERRQTKVRSTAPVVIIAIFRVLVSSPEFGVLASRKHGVDITRPSFPDRTGWMEQPISHGPLPHCAKKAGG